MLFTVDKECDLGVNGNGYGTKDIKDAYLILFNKIFGRFENSENVDFLRLRRACVMYVRLVVGESFSTKLKNTNNLQELIDEIYELPYCMWNWIDIRMLEKISGVFPKATEDIKQYKATFYSRKLVVEDITKSDIPKDFIKIKEKWNREVKDIVIQDIINHWLYIEKKLNVKSCLLLYCITAGERWVEIDWLLRDSQDLFDCAYNSARNSNHSGMLDAEVFYLSIGGRFIRNLSYG